MTDRALGSAPESHHLFTTGCSVGLTDWATQGQLQDTRTMRANSGSVAA